MIPEYNTTKEYCEIFLSSVTVGPYKTRKSEPVASLLEMVESVRKFGIIQPIIVRRTRFCKYELISGERRLAAARTLGFKTIPAVIVSVNEDEAVLLSLVENLHRKGLTCFEEAEAFENLLNYFEISIDELSSALSLTRTDITAKLKTLSISPFLRKVITDNKLAEKNVRTIAAIPYESDRWKRLRFFIAQNGERSTEGGKEQAESTGDSRKELSKGIMRAVAAAREAGMLVEARAGENESGYEYSITVRR